MVFFHSLKNKIIIGVASGVGIIAAGVIAYILITAPEDYRSIKVDGLFGTTVITDKSNVSENAYKGMNLKSGDNVFVETESNMTLLFDADKYMFADEGTKFKVVASGNSEKSTTRTKIILEEGSVLCRLDTKLSDAEVYEIETLNSTMSVRGTIFKVSIYKDENGENCTRVDVLEGAVEVNLHYEDGEETGDEGLVEAGKSATVHSNPEISEFVIGESNISYEDFNESMAHFVVNTVDSGKEICVEKDIFIHYTGLENHPEKETVAKEATCTVEGEKEISCSICEMVVRVEPISTIDHTLGEWIVEEEAPCMERLRCIVCDGLIEERELDFSLHTIERETIETKEGCKIHTVISDVCQICGTKKEVSVEDTVEHTYGDWKIVTPSTCVTSGVKQIVCEVCGDSQRENISATGHSYRAWTVVRTAACLTDGLEERECRDCGNKQTQTIKATGHNYQNLPGTEATCLEDGERKEECSNCGDTVTTVIPALGHSLTYSHNYYELDFVSNTFTVAYIGKCSRCRVPYTSESHSGTFVISGNTTEVSCGCGYSDIITE